MSGLRATCSFVGSSIFVVGCALGEPRDGSPGGVGGYGVGGQATSGGAEGWIGDTSGCGGLPARFCAYSGGAAAGGGGGWVLEPGATGGCAETGGTSAGGGVSTGGYVETGGAATGGYAETGGTSAGGGFGTGGGYPTGGGVGFDYFQASISLGIGSDQAPELARFNSLTVDQEWVNLESVGSCYWYGAFEFTRERFPDAVFRSRVDGEAGASLAAIQGGEHVVVSMHRPPDSLTPWKSEFYAPLPGLVSSKLIDLETHAAVLPRNRNVKLKLERPFAYGNFEARSPEFVCFGSEEIEIPRAIMSRLAPGTRIRVSQVWSDSPEVLGGPLYVNYSQPVVAKDGIPVLFAVGE